MATPTTSIVVLMIMLLDPQIPATNISGQTVPVEMPRKFSSNEECIEAANKINIEVKKVLKFNSYITYTYKKGRKGLLLGSWCLRKVQ